MITLAKDVRNAKVDGFTVENLKNELRNLGLLATFPNIHQHAQLAYDTVLKAKKDTYLRTCDLFDAVEQCQLLCFLEKMPKYAHFVHLQHSCNRVVGLKCKWCEKEKKTKRVEPQRAADQIMPPLVKIVHNQESPLKKPLVIVEKMVLPETSQQPEKESGCCKKCLRTSEMCNAAKEELKLERNRSKSLEKKVNAAEKVLNGVKEREKKKREAIERKLNEATKKIECLQKENEVASKKIERLTSENKETTEKLLKRNEEFLSACGTISRLEAEKEEHETTVRTLLEKIAEMSEKANVFHQPPPGILPSTSLSSVVSQQIVCGDANAVMLKLLEIKRFLVSEDHLGKAGEIAEQLISMNKSEGIFDGVTFEMERYHDAFNTFAYVVDQNIQKIECDPSISYQEMLSLPDFPSFSDRFMHEYEMAIKETSGPKAQKAKRDELEDNECLVCLTEMGDTEETIKCHHCKRRYHSECAVEWLKIKSVCPACNSGLLDPAEFPDL